MGSHRSSAARRDRVVQAFRRFALTGRSRMAIDAASPTDAGLSPPVGFAIAPITFAFPDT
ncbi:hypothetical protein OCOJLMKI_2186 [Methylobacterium iners]|uniref:Uncharacterized protein n=1 Tax=Methylobacterium iners TaxID=418707 RepID=A0ABQ4RXQ7_9HYPH|nr:hypothetical protein OCOJLMKI_2186 [Methylobacterium iners]